MKYNDEDMQRLSLGKFKNKRIRIEGTVDTVSKQYSLIKKTLKKTVLCLKNVTVNKDELYFSHLWIEINEKDTFKIRKGQKICLTGTVYGYCRNSGIRGYTVKNIDLK